MLGDLSPEIIGTDPKYPSIVNQEWLKPDTYDNYPSDNNSVRIQPKLSEMWNNESGDTGINLIPNSVQPLGIRDVKINDKGAVIREAKKAIMAGLKGSELASHLRSRFTANEIITAKEELASISKEIGLLGNVYIDASAFKSATEAEQFLKKYRNRLARDIVVGKVDPVIANYLARKFRKNVISDISYNEDLFKKYRPYLEDSGKISKDYVIDSKESLRLAFLSEPEQKKTKFAAKKKKKLSEERIAEGLSKNAEINSVSQKLAEEELVFHSAYPIISFIREQMSKGKNGNALKEILCRKYASVDIKKSAKYIKFAISDLFTTESVDRLVKENRISRKTGNELKKLIKKYPIKSADEYKFKEFPKTAGIKSYLYALTGKKKSNSNLCASAVESLKRGFSVNTILDKLAEKVSRKEAYEIISQAVQEFNEVSAGIKANVHVNKPKKKVVADLPEKQTLPDPDTVSSQIQEILSFYDGADTDIEVDSMPENKSLNIKLGSVKSSGYEDIL